MFDLLKKKIGGFIDNIVKKKEEPVEEKPKTVEVEPEIKSVPDAKPAPEPIKIETKTAPTPSKPTSAAAKLPLNRAQALELVKKYNSDKLDLNHFLESEAVMRALARKLGEDEEYWGMLGLVHDIDWGATKGDTKNHLSKMPELLKGAGFDDKFIAIVLSHGYGFDCSGLQDKKRTEKIQHALACAETVTGLVHAYALMRGGFEGMEAKGLRKKYKDASFAASVRRDVIAECEQVGISLDEFLQLSIAAIGSIAGELYFPKKEEKTIAPKPVIATPPTAPQPATPKPAPKAAPLITPTPQPSPKEVVEKPVPKEMPSAPKELQPTPKELPPAPKELPKSRVVEEKPKDEPKAKVSLFKQVTSIFTGEVEINEPEVRELLETLELELLESDVAIEVADEIKTDLRNALVGSKIKRGELNSFVKSTIKNTLIRIVKSEKQQDILTKLSEPGAAAPIKILFLGVNGAGKTTTMAKVARMLMNNGKTVVFASADTFRAAAIEQLQVHADRLGVRNIKRDYGSDPTAVAYDAVNYAKAHNIDAVLIDTAGRQETDLNLVNELKKISRVIQPDLKLYIGESIAGNAILSQVEDFNKAIGIDGVILTKLDCDAKGGTVLSITKSTGIPIVYVGTGQKYEDLEKFDAEKIIERILE